MRGGGRITLQEDRTGAAQQFNEIRGPVGLAKLVVRGPTVAVVVVVVVVPTGLAGRFRLLLEEFDIRQQGVDRLDRPSRLRAEPLEEHRALRRFDRLGEGQNHFAQLPCRHGGDPVLDCGQEPAEGQACTSRLAGHVLAAPIVRHPPTFALSRARSTPAVASWFVVVRCATVLRRGNQSGECAVLPSLSSTTNHVALNSASWPSGVPTSAL